MRAKPFEIARQDAVPRGAWQAIYAPSLSKIFRYPHRKEQILPDSAALQRASLDGERPF
ncbi:hypothetical protein [Bosea sp. BH3]|uniref:hypothetical protein n=1 Tax=Bosea sp. BH3 TaxID=2871701 RepID=UPI0021CB2865|nr:hypothetical protein [Bosea sp. BH3]MCU4178823.1 hypothetical protein [Bosea sp. BH3]